MFPCLMNFFQENKNAWVSLNFLSFQYGLKHAYTIFDELAAVCHLDTVHIKINWPPKFGRQKFTLASSVLIVSQ